GGVGACADAAPGARRRLGRGAVREPGRGAVREPGRGAVREPGRGAVREPGRGAVREPGRGAVREPGRGAVRGQGVQHSTTYRCTPPLLQPWWSSVSRGEPGDAVTRGVYGTAPGTRGGRHPVRGADGIRHAGVDEPMPARLTPRTVCAIMEPNVRSGWR